MIAYSLLLIVVMIFKPSGLMGQYDFSLTGLIDKARMGKLFKKGKDKKEKAGNSLSGCRIDFAPWCISDA